MKSLIKEYHINATADNVFKALTDSTEIEQWSGASVIMELEPKGAFSLWGGSILGNNEVIEKRCLKQLWKENKWEDYSQVTFEIIENDHQTILKLTHENIPTHALNDIDSGWDDYYLEPLKSFLEQTNN